MLDNPVHIVPVDGNSVLGETVKVRRIEHIPTILRTRDEDHSSRTNATFDATDLDFVEPLAHSVGEPQEDQTIPPFLYKIVVGDLGHRWG